eukprot:TRINITY_DN3768_c0_g1_i1.p1 TRINITY_DN3768_c0_g1~~TRINITY_DN3768_c0_g1_i1.p1  ORF type:complete len:282 (-),score=49.38 TRINITY_DN3768_c0_g1_i1:49-894(-)
MTFQATLHDNTTISVTVRGEGPALFLPIRTSPHPEATAKLMREWGADPDLGVILIRELSKSYKVIAADYLGHRLNNPAPHTLSAENVSSDFVAIVNSVGEDRFAYYGYSWLGSCGLQLALRTDRLWALIMGAFPPLCGPYPEMLKVSNCAYFMSQRKAEESKEESKPGDWSNVKVQTSEDQTKQFATYYQSLQDFDDSKVDLKDLSRFCFAGEKDEIVYGEEWGGVTVKFAEPLVREKERLEQKGWRVHVLNGLDHSSADHANVLLPLFKEWLSEAQHTHK